MRNLLLSILLAFSAQAFGQLLSDTEALDQMRFDVQYLASDLLEGREAGTKGEQLAVDYIKAKFGNAGLMPYGDNAGYVQAFKFAAEPQRGANCTLQLGRKKPKLDEQWFPLGFTGSMGARGKVLKLGYGIVAPELNYSDYPDTLEMKERVVAFSVSSPDGIHPHSKYLAHHDLQARAQRAAERGAAAVLFYNDDPTAPSPEGRLSAKVKPIGIPVIFLKGDLHEQLVIDNNPCAIHVDIVREERTAYNVVGMIDNGAPNVVVIGAPWTTWAGAMKARSTAANAPSTTAPMTTPAASR
ncbi:MAG: hypothetical protein IPF41_03605 [Flavobacteriales bacterium]|nr:hypothetical protein [Flavobacteriales bacterium]